MTRTHGDLVIRFAPDATNQRLLLVSEMYRPGWRALAPTRDLPVGELLSGLIGIDVPAGVSEVELRYRPTWLIASTLGAWTTVGVALVAFGVRLKRQRVRF